MYNLTPFAESIFKKRHAISDTETFGQACNRVATHVSNAETGEARDKARADFEHVLTENYFMPGGRIWHGAGRPRGNLLNCFVIKNEDSREGWAKTVADTIIISGTGGGVGTNFSQSRPRGTPIRGTGGESTGAVSCMEMVNSVGDVIRMGGGRRVALMFCLSLAHGDLVEFLDKKLDLNQLNNANVSVVFDNDPNVFFDLVKADGDWPLMHQGKEIGRLKAKALWNRIITNALKGGEPGMLNGYLANKMSNIYYVEPLTSTNPCQPAWATVLTPEGIRTIGEITIGDTIWSGVRWTKVINKWSTGMKQVNAYRTRAGTFYGTENHRVVQGGEKIKVKDAEGIDRNAGPMVARKWERNQQTVVDGLVFGGGTYHAASGRNFLCAGPEEIQEYRMEFGVLIGAHRPGVNDLVYEAANTLDPLPLTFDRRIPSKIRNGSFETKCDFLRGLYTANGSFVGGSRITLKAASFAVIEDVQQMFSSLGVVSYYTVNKPTDIQHHNGIYTSRQSYDLNILGAREREFFAKHVGYIQRHKMDKLLGAIETLGESFKPVKTTFDICEIEQISVEEVFDLTVEADEHTYWTGGLSVGNCGEIWMSPYDCCCLGALVLPRFVSATGKMNWDTLRDTVKTGVRFLDNVLSVNQYPLPEIAAKCAQLRRIGLGVMGLHHMLLELGLAYNSPDGLEFVDLLMKRIKNWSYEASSDLAVEKGSFTAFDTEKFLKSNFVKTLKPSIREKIRTQGIRNCALNTIAPTGTIAMVCDVSSGIEPIFAAAYESRSFVGHDRAMEVVVDPLFKKAVAAGKNIMHFVGAQDLSARDHLEMQRVCQRHVDNAVSKTINLPQGTGPETLSELYMEFFPELKGVTVYPDGSRENQPLTPIPLERAEQLAFDALAETTSNTDCPSGVCDI